MSQEGTAVLRLSGVGLTRNGTRLLEQIDETYPAEQAENLRRKLLNAIGQRDPGKFTRTVRRTDANT